MNPMLDVCSRLDFGADLQCDFLGKGNIWIENTYDESVIDLARNIITQALVATAPGQLTIYGYDSDLTGIFSPFASLSAGDSHQLYLLQEEKDLDECLLYTKHHIQAVQNVIQGRERNLTDFLKRIDSPIEGYRLVVLSMDMGMIKQDLRTRLSMLLRKGPAYGVSFLIISTSYMTIETSSGRTVELSVGDLAPNISLLEASGTYLTETASGRKGTYHQMSADVMVNVCANFIEDAKHMSLPTCRFDEIHDMTSGWNNSSADGLTFTVGKYGINQVDITIGDEINQRHNVVITGAVGQGKSNLISVIIHSLCCRYSPDELELYLMDFKEGVSFKIFSNIDRQEYLPHARTLGLESDVAFGMAVMDHLFRLYKERMKLLKKYNEKSIRDFRHAYPEIRMPRIVVVIDEFQLMFGEDFRQGQEIADMLEKSVRLFRAAGIHFILASQSLSDNQALAQKRSSIFSQIPIRIALKNSAWESRATLSENNNEAAFLRPREAIVNMDYGEISQNRKTMVAFADETYLEGIRHAWWESARNNYKPPYVFETDRRAAIADSVKSAMTTEKRCPAAMFGDLISVIGEHIEIPMRNEPGRNVAIIGSSDAECDQVLGMMEGAALTLARFPEKKTTRFIFTDFNRTGAEFSEENDAFIDLMREFNHEPEIVDPADFENMLSDVSFAQNQKVYIFAMGMDRYKPTADPFGDPSPLKSFVENGPSKGIHFIGAWVKSSAYSAQVAGFGNSEAFNTKIFLRTDERTVQNMTNPFVHWTSTENRALISDAIEFTKEVTFIPYAPVTENDIRAIRNSIR